MTHPDIGRVAMISVHTSPLAQPGTGDAGGLNVYVVESALELAARGIEVEIFTRATTGGLRPAVELAPGVLVRHVPAGPYGGLAKEELPAQLCDFTHGVMLAWAGHRPGYYDLVHSHYWLSGHVGRLAAERWGVPLVHTMHTMAKVKNLLLAQGDKPEPQARVVGEQQVVEIADRLVANTADEARELMNGRFVECFIATSLEDCEARDVKGLYAKARSGEIPEFTGVSDPYEPPENPELLVETAGKTPEESAQQVLDYLEGQGLIPAKG